MIDLPSLSLSLTDLLSLDLSLGEIKGIEGTERFQIHVNIASF